jgi:hypothetical protein
MVLQFFLHKGAIFRWNLRTYGKVAGGDCQNFKASDIYLNFIWSRMLLLPEVSKYESVHHSTGMSKQKF